MTDDKIVKDTARNPERESLGPGRGGIRAAAKRAARKVAKKVVRKTSQKKVAKKTTVTAGKTAKKAAKSAARADKPAAAKVSAPASRTTPARSSASRTKATTGRAAAKASTTARVSAAAAASKGDASAPAAAPYEPGPAIETLPPPGPMHPGAAMDSRQEHVGGLGSLLALWGPLIIVAFLVLVFRGGEERDSTVAVGPDTASEAAARTSDAMAHRPLVGATIDPARGALPDESMSAPSGVPHGPAEAFDGGFTMRTSMATPVFAGGGTATGMPPVASGRIYPSPPGPYRDPRYRSLPTGESWSTGNAGDWMWSAEGRGHPGRDDGGDAPVQWVRCAPPYYWCPAPSSPTW